MTNKQQIHEGTLLLDQHKRYSICEPERPASQIVTLTSGCSLEVLLGDTWIRGHVEGDGQDYWLFVSPSGKFKLAEGLVVRYTKPVSVLSEGV